jgi:DNA invertase Pin-like site-specific DNA recombinase
VQSGRRFAYAMVIPDVVAAAATANGRRTGRPTVVNPTKLEHAVLLRDKGAPIAEICTKTGMSRSTLYRHLPPHEPTDVTARTKRGSGSDSASRFGGLDPKP